MKNAAAAHADVTNMFFGFSYWGCPYGRNASEYFLTGPFEDRAAALASVKRSLKNGQPRSFTDWVSGPAKVLSSVEAVSKACSKHKLHVPKFDVDELVEAIETDSPLRYILRKQ